MKFLRPFEYWDRGFESYLRHGCLCAVLCVGSGLVTGQAHSPGITTDCVKDQETEKVAKAQQRAVEP
jgi:hypothetical protein